MGLPLSEKQIPQVVENLENGDESREALETGTLRVKQALKRTLIVSVTRWHPGSMASEISGLIPRHTTP